MMAKFKTGNILVAETTRSKNNIYVKVDKCKHDKRGNVIGYFISKIYDNGLEVKLRPYYEYYVLDLAFKLYSNETFNL